MSFWKSLFSGGGSNAAAKEAPPAEVVEHKGFRIEARPFEEGGQYQIAGTIKKVVNGVAKEHKFIRADRCAGRDEAITASVIKAQQIVDLQGERMFD